MSVYMINLVRSACLVSLVFVTQLAFAQEETQLPETVSTFLVDQAVAKVKPALVRIQVVSTRYSEGREFKNQSSGSGVIITKEGHVVTNHHVAGHAARLVCTLATREEVEAELVGRDALTDIAVIKLLPKDGREFPTAVFGDSDKIQVGDQVLAMGSPMSLSQSVTLGIVSNAELVMPEWFGRWGRIQLDGEDVGSLVRWIGHDAQIFGGNSGGPLVNLQGEIIGINEISIGLGGAIPGNLAREVAFQLIENGEVRRAWLGLQMQPRLKMDETGRGVLVADVLEGGPAEEAGFEAGDLLLSVQGEALDVQFLEQLPGANQIIASLPIDEEVEAVVLRDSKETTLLVTPKLREEAYPQEQEIKQWGITARDLSYQMVKEFKRESEEGVAITSVRPGGPVGDAKPQLTRDDVIVKVGDEKVRDLAHLRKITARITKGQEEPVPTLVQFEREKEEYLTVVEVGLEELEDPGREVKKAWLPVRTQVLTRDIADNLGYDGLTGFRVTHVFEGTTAEEAGLKVGDYVLEVDGLELTANAPEDYDELPQLIRQYREDDVVELAIMRDGERMTLPVKLMRSPKLPREMLRYRDDRFEFTVRDITFFDKADKDEKDDLQAVYVEEVQSGGWADVGLLQAGDLVLTVNGEVIPDVATMEQVIDGVSASKPDSVVFKVLRGIHTAYLEIEPNWTNATPENGKE